MLARLCVLVIAIGLCWPDARISAAFSAERLRARLQALVDAGTTPSIAAAVGRDGRILWSGAAGFADVARKVAATAETPYSLASISKPFTATAVMVLNERKLVELRAPFERYLGPLPRPGSPDAREVTVERLLRHQAGFPTHYQFFYDDERARPLPFAERLGCYGVQLAAPGARYNYSNLGYGVLGELVARVSGIGYGEALAREVLKPLGLSHTFVPDGAADVADAAVRYGNDGLPLPFYVTDHPAGSEVYASAEDLVRFGLFHAGAPVPGHRNVLSASSREAMRKPGAGNYGLGWSINQDWNGRTVIWHSGGMPGVATTLWVAPSERIAIALVANKSGVPVNQIAAEFLAEILETPVPASTPGGSRESASEGRAATPLAGRWRGALRDCAGGDAFAIDIQSGDAAAITVNGGTARPMHSVEASKDRFASSGRGTDDRISYQFDLRLEGSMLTGVVRRTTSLGTRGSNSVTLPIVLTRL